MSELPRALPFLQIAALCERADQGEGGDYTLHHIFDTTVLRVPRALPDPPPPLTYQFTLATCWTGGVGHFQERVQILEPGGDLLWESKEAVFWLQSKSARHSNFRRITATIRDPGRYAIRILRSGQPVAELLWTVEIQRV
ncbi:MAG: hypothetical protein HY684_05460 [Chloroflexi bacterium]|nr:hypothetical protein [Chloroflexota bacterium]